jgi:hypothetical protein
MYIHFTDFQKCYLSLFFFFFHDPVYLSLFAKNGSLKKKKNFFFFFFEIYRKFINKKIFKFIHFFEGVDLNLS